MTPLATSTGFDHPPSSRRETQIPTSLLPSSVPANHAASSEPSRVSTIVEAWQPGVGGASRGKISSAFSAASGESRSPAFAAAIPAQPRTATKPMNNACRLIAYPPDSFPGATLSKSHHDYTTVTKTGSAVKHAVAEIPRACGLECGAKKRAMPVSSGNIAHRSRFDCLLQAASSAQIPDGGDADAAEKDGAWCGDWLAAPL